MAFLRAAVVDTELRDDGICVETTQMLGVSQGIA